MFSQLCVFMCDYIVCDIECEWKIACQKKNMGVIWSTRKEKL